MINNCNIMLECISGGGSFFILLSFFFFFFLTKEAYEILSIEQNEACIHYIIKFIEKKKINKIELWLRYKRVNCMGVRLILSANVMTKGVICLLALDGGFQKNSK